jgi:hypothetical protein
MPITENLGYIFGPITESDLKMIIIVDGFGNISYWTSSLCYLSLATLTFLSQKRPFLHHRIRTFCCCLRAAILSWPIAALLTLTGWCF